MHAMIGPSCAVADVRGDKATVWSGSQAPFITRNGVARLLGVPEHNVHFIYTEGSGCYGRLEPDDAPEDAALLSRAVGKPVRVQWMRADEHAWEPKGPPQLISIRSGIDAQGNVLAWEYNERTLALDRCAPLSHACFAANRHQAGRERHLSRRQRRRSLQFRKPQSSRLGHSRGSCRRIRCAPAICARLTARRAASPPNRKWTKWPRQPKADPVEYRLRHLSGPDSKRVVDVLNAVTKQAQWQARPSHSQTASGNVVAGRGLALSGLAGTVVAQVADIEIDKTSGHITVKKITVAHDCGIIVNPDGLRNQIEGNVVQGASRSLMEEVDFDANGVKRSGLVELPHHPLQPSSRCGDCADQPEELEPMGAGEAASIATGAAIAQRRLRRNRRAPARSALHAGARASRAAKRQGLRRRREAVFGSFLHVFDR